MGNTVIFIVAVPLAAAVYFVFLYNRLVSLKTRVSEAWSDVDVQLRKRFDLILSLMEAVKSRDDLEIVGELKDMQFDSEGNLSP